MRRSSVERAKEFCFATVVGVVVVVVGLLVLKLKIMASAKKQKETKTHVDDIFFLQNFLFF
jgi:hypothetical protein